MTAAQEHDPDPYLLRTIRDGAAPLATALHAIYDGHQGGFRVHGVTFTYSDDGISVDVNEGLDQKLREEMYGHLIDAFSAAGWGFSSTLDRERGMRRKGMAFRHPSTLRCMGASEPFTECTWTRRYDNDDSCSSEALWLITYFKGAETATADACDRHAAQAMDLAATQAIVLEIRRKWRAVTH